MGKYDDIIDLPPHVSKVHPRMPLSDRAAQFASFAALEGHAETVGEKSRLTEHKPQLYEDKAAILDKQLQKIDGGSTVRLTCFIADSKKSGGAFVTVVGTVRTVDFYNGKIIFSDRREVAFSEIEEIEFVKNREDRDL